VEEGLSIVRISFNFEIKRGTERVFCSCYLTPAEGVFGSAWKGGRCRCTYYILISTGCEAHAWVGRLLV